MDFDESTLKDDLNSFFDNVLNNAAPQLNQEHFELNEKLSQFLGVKICLDDDRNYRHSDALGIYIHPTRGVINNLCSHDQYADHDYVKKHGGEIWELFIFLSDVGSYASHYWNKRTCIGEGKNRDCEVKFVLDDVELPSAVLKAKNQVLDLVVDSGYAFINTQYCSQEVSWLNTKLNLHDFSPRLFELLFGGYELYSEAGI